jgi:hypothetical protein
MCFTVISEEYVLLAQNGIIKLPLVCFCCFLYTS